MKKKIVAKILTREEQIVQSIERAKLLAGAKDGNFIPLPSNRSFAVGDDVKLGNLESPKILHITEDGRYYTLEYGRKGILEISTFVWYDVYPARSVETSFAAPRESYSLSFMQMDISSLMTKRFNFGVFDDPVYQRGLVWDEADCEKLIDSIFADIDIGKMTFVKRPYRDHDASYEVIDGKQRLNCLTDFMCDRFKYKGYFFSQLSNMDKHRFENHAIAVAEIDGEKLTELDKVKIFLKLNVSGKPQSASHIQFVEEYKKQLEG